MTGVYLPKPCKMDPIRESGFRMRASENDSWMDRIMSDKTRVEVHLSTDPSEEPVGSWELIGEPRDVFNRVKNHMLFKRDYGTLLPGVYTISVPGSALKHSFEVV